MDLSKTISLLHRKMNTELNVRLMEIGLSNAQSRLLKLLYKSGVMTQADLCSELEMDKSTVAKMLVPLEENGFITRTINPEDARSFLVFLTDQAIEIIPQMLEVTSSWTRDVTAIMTKEEKELFYQILDKLTQQAVLISNTNMSAEN